MTTMIVKAKDQSTPDPIEELIKSTNEENSKLMTPYQGAKLINEWIKDLGVERILPPQMIYTYTKKNMIKNTNGKVSEKDLREWFEKYSAKNLIKV